jgi:hypothetical protein
MEYPSPDHQPGHSHCDVFSFDFACIDAVNRSSSTPVRRRTKITNRRYLERSTGAHNTVQVGSFRSGGDLGILQESGRRPSIYNLQESSDFISGVHDGFMNGKFQHERRFDFRLNGIEISDTVIPRSPIPSFAYLHFHPDRSILQKESTLISGNDVKITFSGSRRISLEEYKIALGFNKLQTAICAVIEFDNSLVTRIHIV